MFLRLLIVLVLALPGSVQAEPARVAIVDVDLLFKEYHVAKAKRGSIESLRERLSDDPRIELIEGLRTEMAAIKKRLRDPQTLISEKEQLFREFQSKSHEANSLQRDIRQHMASEQSKIDAELVKLTRTLLAHIRTEIAAYAESEGFELVFETSGNTSSQVPTLVYSRHAPDITPAVLARLNRDEPADAEKPAVAPVSTPP